MNDHKASDDKNRAAREGENLLDMDPAERTAEAVAMREAGDPRPVSQIEQENLAADDQVVEAEKAAAAHIEEAERLREENKRGRRPDRRDSGERDPELSRGKSGPAADVKDGDAHSRAHP